MKRKGVCVCWGGGGGWRKGKGGEEREGWKRVGEGGKKDIILVCVQVLIFPPPSSRKILAHTHAISQHDVDQFPTSVRLIEKVAAQGGQTTVTLPHDLPDCIKTLVPTASRMGVLHLIRVPPMDDFLCLSQNMSPSFSCKLQPYTGKKFHIPINGVATVFYRFPLLYSLYIWSCSPDPLGCTLGTTHFMKMGFRTPSM